MLFVVCIDDALTYTSRSGDLVQLNVKTNETSVIISNATLVNIRLFIVVIVVVVTPAMTTHNALYLKHTKY